MAGSGGNYRGLFCVFLLLLLVAMLAVASLVLQIYSWTELMNDDEENHDDGTRTRPPERDLPSESDAIREIRETLAMFQPDNGRGPPIQEVLEHRKYAYEGDDRVWIFAMDWSSSSKLAYFDVSTGRRGGYYVDMVNAVCQAARKNCRMVSQDDACWERGPYGARGGPALHSGWVDGCVGYAQSYLRSLSFDFTDALSPAPDVNFYTLPGNPLNFDWRDLRGKKIGLLERSYTDVDCVARNADKIQGADLAADQYIEYSSEEALLDAIKVGEIDAGFFDTQSKLLASELEVASNRITNCALGGHAVMIRRGSKVRDWWNPAMQKVLNSYEYREICKDVDDYYSGLPGGSADEICRSGI